MIDKSKYTIFGVLITIASFIYLIILFNSLRTGSSFMSDGFWFRLIGAIAGLITGVLYVLLGNGKFKINKYSDRSIKLMLTTLIIGLVATLLIFILTMLTNDPTGLILIYFLSFVASVLVILSLIFLAIAIIKKKK